MRGRTANSEGMSEGANEVDPSSFVVRSFVPSFLRSFVRLSFVRSFVLSFVCCRSFLPSFLPSFVWKFGPLVHFFWPLEIVGRWSLVVGRWSFGGCWLERLVIGLFGWLCWHSIQWRRCHCRCHSLSLVNVPSRRTFLKTWSRRVAKRA